MKIRKDRLVHGVGGIACPCCNLYACHPRKSKPLERRYIRRKTKQSIVNDMNP